MDAGEGMNGGAEGCRKRRALVAETEREIRVCVCEGERVQLEKASCAAVCMLHLVACQKSAAGDRNTIKLKAIVSALPFVSAPLASESYYSRRRQGDTTQWISISHPTPPCLYGTINKSIQSFQPPPRSWSDHMYVATAGKVEQRRPKVCSVASWPSYSPSSLLELRQEGLNRQRARME